MPKEEGEHAGCTGWQGWAHGGGAATWECVTLLHPACAVLSNDWVLCDPLRCRVGSASNSAIGSIPPTSASPPLRTHPAPSSTYMIAAVTNSAGQLVQGMSNALSPARDASILTGKFLKHFTTLPSSLKGWGRSAHGAHFACCWEAPPSSSKPRSRRAGAAARRRRVDGRQMGGVCVCYSKGEGALCGGGQSIDTSVTASHISRVPWCALQLHQACQAAPTNPAFAVSQPPVSLNPILCTSARVRVRARALAGKPTTHLLPTRQ